jgi:hypothetical protein
VHDYLHIDMGQTHNILLLFLVEDQATLLWSPMFLQEGSLALMSHVITILYILQCQSFCHFRLCTVSVLCYLTERHNQMVNTSSYLGGSVFKSWPGDWLF